MTCPSCGTETSDGARFCPSCGHFLQNRADERRIVTVLFADLVGFTTLSELRDPEQVKNLVDRCFERLVADVKAYGGRIDKIIGDAIVALFGAPVAHEDDAERAVRAALQMQRTLADMTAALGDDVQLRIGVNTGEVLVGALRAGGDYTAMGDVVNVASRLQTLAKPGEVVAGAATHAATREIVHYEFMGDVQARGRESPVEAWKAVEALAPPGHRPRRTSGPLIGRDEELGILRHTLASSLTRSRPHLVLLLGEAGIGKSRLAEELTAVARAEPHVLVLEGRCVPYGEANLWWPVAEALRQACRIDPTDPADLSAKKCLTAVALATGLHRDSPETTRIAGGLLYLMGDEHALPEVDAARAADEARRSVLTMLEALARAQPLVIVLAELHWADPLVLDLVDQVLDRLRNLPVMLVATARPELEDRWVPRPGRYNLVVVNLDPLDHKASKQLLTTLLGDVPGAELRDMLMERSGGNPFFLEELVALLMEAGVLRHEGGAYHLEHDRAANELPATLRGLVSARLDALPQRERATLEDAAILGHTGPVTALAAMALARHEAGIASTLESLAAKDLLTIVDGEAEFRSELVREVAYETLTKTDRARRHAALAQWLAQSSRSTDREDEYYEQLAHHYGAAAELAMEMGHIDGLPDDICDQALDAIKRAAVRTFERDQHHVTVRLLDQALRLLPSTADKPLRWVYLSRAEARSHLHDLAGARADLDAVMGLIDHEKNPRSLALALRIRGMIEQIEGDLAASAITLDQASELYQRLGDARGEAETMRHRGMTSLFAGDPEGAEHAIRSALKTFRELKDRKEEAWALWNLAWISFSTGDMDASEERLTKSAQAFTEVNDYGGVGWTLGLLGFVRMYQGRRAEAADLAQRVLGESRERGDRWGQGMMLVLLSVVHLWEGQTQQAAPLAAEALRLFTDMGEVSLGFEMASAYLARARVAMGDVDGAIAVMQQADVVAARTKGSLAQGFAYANIYTHVGAAAQALEALGQTTSSPFGDGEVGRAEGDVIGGLARLQLGDVRAALACLEAAADGATSMGERCGALAALALARAAGGDADGAIAAGEELQTIVESTFLDRARGLLAIAFAHLQQGRLDQAETSFADATAIVDGTGDLVAQATVRLAHGRALEAVGSHDAPRVLAEAHERLREIGIAAEGWDTAFGLAATAAGATASRS